MLDFPMVPDHLILPMDEVLQLENIFGGETKNYTIHECQDELKEHLKVLFPEYTKFRYQTLIGEIPVHKDRGRTHAINYLIKSGGTDVKTYWYKEDWTTPIYGIKLPEKTWYELQVDQYHSVLNIETRRFAITIG
jgi:hypothetical protein